MHERSLVSVKVEPRSTPRLSSALFIQLLRERHPRRPRGSQSGWEKRQDESFQVRAKEPLGTDSHRTISKNSSRCRLLIGNKKCFVILRPIGEQFLLSLRGCEKGCRKKKWTRQSRKVIWDWSIHCSWHCSCRTYFCCFPLALANIRPWPLVPFFQISLNNSELKTTHSTFRDCRVQFLLQPFSK